MSKELREKLEKARHDLLNKQRKCAWCGHVAETADGLIRHLLESVGTTNHDRQPLSADESELLRILREKDAK